MLNNKVENRINATLNFQEADRVPICDFLDNPKIFHYFSHTSAISIKEKIKAYHELGIDICWRFERRKTKRHKGFLDVLHRFALRRPNFDVLDQKELVLEFDDFQEQQKLFSPLTYLAMSADGCLGIAYRNLGIEEFSKKMYAEPIVVERLIDIYAENLYLRIQEFTRRKLGNIFFIKDDIASNKGLIFSISFLQKLWLPRIKSAIKPLKDSNIKVILHSKGNITEIINDLIDIGIDGIHPVDVQAGMNIAILKKTYAKALLLFGNVNLFQSDPEVIEEQTRQCIQKASYGGGHFIGSNDGITKDLDLKKIFSFFTAIKEYGQYSS